MLRAGHAASARAWKTTCRTPAGDARQAALTTTLNATDSSMSFYEAGQYQFVIQGQNCTASVGRYRTYTLVQRAGTPDSLPPAPSQQAATPAAPRKADSAEANRCATPGPAARLEVRPARKLMRAGEDFSFRAIVFDASGCLLYVHPTWAIDGDADHADLSPAGAVHIHPDAPEGEIRLNAAVGGRSALVTIEIASSERYDGLLKSGAFNADGEVDEAATVAIASQSIGAASAVAEDTASRRKKLFVWFVGAVALLLAVGSAGLYWNSRRTTRVRDAEDAARRARRPAVQPRPPEPREATAPSPAVPAAPPVAVPVAPAPKTICPVCGQQCARGALLRDGRGDASPAELTFGWSRHHSRERWPRARFSSLPDLFALPSGNAEMIVDCLSCGATYNISDDKVRGRRVRVRCKSCGDGIIVDGAQLAAEDATRVYSPSFEPAGDATRVYSPNFEPAAYAAAEGRDESTRVMSSPAVDWQQAEPGEWTVNLSETEQRTMGQDELVRGYNSGTMGTTRSCGATACPIGFRSSRFRNFAPRIENAEATRVVSPAVAVRAPLGRGAALAAPPAPVTYSAPVAPPRAVQWTPAPEATVEYAPPRPPAPPLASAPARAAAPPPAAAAPPAARAAARAAPPARVREGRPRGADLFGSSDSASQAEELLSSSSLPLAQYDEKPIGARNENSVLFSLDTLKAGARRGGPSSLPPRLPQSSPQTAADILGLSAGGALPGMDSMTALLSAPAVEAPAPMAVVEAPQQRSRMNTTPPTSRGKGQVLLIAAVVAGAVAVAGGAFVVLRSRMSATGTAASAEPTTAALGSAARPAEAPVAAAPTARVATAAVPPAAPAPAPPAAVAEAPQAAAAPAQAVALVAAPKSGAAAQAAKIEAMKAALLPDDATKGAKPAAEKASGKVVLAEDTSGGATTGGTDAPAAEEKAEEPPKPPFDTGAAKAALESASSNAASCKKPDGPTGRGKVQITFSPSGRATSANVVEGAFGGTPTGGCVAKIFRGARVPAFSGDPVTVSKSFNIPE